MKSKLLCKGEQSSSDIISTLPQPILETILCLLPTKEAARTSILSREWRYKWTKIPKLGFYLSQVSKRITEEKQVQEKNMDKICKLFYDLHQILLLHQCPILEFALHIDQWEADHDGSFGLDQIIPLLSKNHTVKKLTLSGWDSSVWSQLPISIFSLHHLTDLHLSNFDLDHYQPTFSGFGSLRNLCLDRVIISTETLLHLLSNCPSLKSLMLACPYYLGYRDCNIIELFKCLPVIEHLTTFCSVTEWLVLDLVPQELPTLPSHLKSFCFKYISFDDGCGLAFLLVLIKCSPKLEKIKLEVEGDHVCMRDYSVVWEEYSDVRLEHLDELEFEWSSTTKTEMELVKFMLARAPKLKKVRIESGLEGDEKSEEYSVWEEFSDVRLEHLNELEIVGFSNLKPEMEFVKFILARSPKLKKVSMHRVVDRDQESEMLKTLLQAPHASQVIITVKSCFID